jgi:plasmid maintenance system antidote protein VapI
MPTEFQQYLLQALKHNAPDGTLLAQELAELLQIGRATAYKKIKGDIPFSVEEALRLARHFHFSIDEYVQRGQGERSVQFAYTLGDVQAKSPEAFLRSIHDDLLKIAQLPDPLIRYATNEVPIFHSLSCPQLLAFKLYVWSRINWRLPPETKQAFDPADFYARYPEIAGYRQRLLCLYQQMPSVEYWPPQLMDNILSQIRYCFFSGLFLDPATPRALCAEMREMLAVRHEMAAIGHKSPLAACPEGDNSASFVMYLNEIAYTNNIILVYVNRRPAALYATMDNPNFMRTSDPAMCAEMHDWVEKVEACSVQISKVGEQHRLHLFDVLQAKIAALERELEEK